MDPYKVLGIPPGASEQEIKRAYLAMASKYHPDHGGDAWIFEQIRTAYEQLTQPTAAHSAARSNPTKSNPKPEAKSPFEKKRKQEPTPNDTHDSNPGQSGFPDPSNRFPTGDTSQSRHFLIRQLPLQTETSWFILINVLDLVLTNILLQRNAIEANPLANMVFVRYGFTGMIVFKLVSVLFVCLAAQIIATKSLSKAKWLLWFGCAVVGAVLIYSCRLIVAMS
ncbi:MAG: DUF5658 family protein [Pirellula sp.]|jgi:hypothetical protein|nr:DUF5658 family protein [Pirellula sp.]